MKKRSGFTLIEVIIALVIISAAFLPLMQMYATTLEQVSYASDLTSAQHIAKTYMEKVKNVGFSKRRILDMGNSIEPPIGEAPLEFNRRWWRVTRLVTPTSAGPIEVTIQVYPIREVMHRAKLRGLGEVERDEMNKDISFLKNKPILELSTLIEDYETAK